MTTRITATIVAIVAIVALACGSASEPQIIEQVAQQQQQKTQQVTPVAQPESPAPTQAQQEEQQTVAATQEAEQQTTPQVQFSEIEPVAPPGTRTAPTKTNNPIDRYLFRWMWLTGEFNQGGSLFVGCRRVADDLLWSDTADEIAALPALKWCHETLTREIRTARGQLYTESHSARTRASTLMPRSQSETSCLTTYGRLSKKSASHSRHPPAPNRAKPSHRPGPRRARYQRTISGTNSASCRPCASPRAGV